MASVLRADHLSRFGCDSMLQWGSDVLVPPCSPSVVIMAQAARPRRDMVLPVGSLCSLDSWLLHCQWQLPACSYNTQLARGMMSHPGNAAREPHRVWTYLIVALLVLHERVNNPSS